MKKSKNLTRKEFWELYESIRAKNNPEVNFEKMEKSETLRIKQ